VVVRCDSNGEMPDCRVKRHDRVRRRCMKELEQDGLHENWPSDSVVS
jgi:hypothetical protein